MNFQLTKEQETVQKLVREFAEAEVEPIAAEIDLEHRFPEETVAKMAKFGLLGIPFDTALGGAGGDQISYAITVEELSRVCATTGVICSAHTSLCCWPIYAYGTDAQKETYLSKLLKGKYLGAFSLTEPSAGTDAAGLQTRAEDKGDYWLLNGTKSFVTNGGYADVFVVIARTDKDSGRHGMTAFIVEKEDEGFSLGKTEHTMGVCAAAATELVFQDCRIPKDRILGKIGEGYKIAMEAFDGEKIGIASQALGIAEGALAATVKYMKSRKQFGKKISQFQALQFEIANMATQIEAARLLVYKAADMRNQQLSYNKHAAMAKLFASETAMYVTTKAVQLHGGYGYTKDYPVERMMRDAKVTEIYAGTSEVQKMVISAAVIGK
jgi:butyryl-CoA dehydrogenase